MGLQSAMEALPEALLPEQRACFMEDLSEQHLWAYLLQPFCLMWQFLRLQVQWSHDNTTFSSKKYGMAPCHQPDPVRSTPTACTWIGHAYVDRARFFQVHALVEHISSRSATCLHKTELERKRTRSILQSSFFFERKNEKARERERERERECVCVWGLQWLERVVAHASVGYASSRSETCLHNLLPSWSKRARERDLFSTGLSSSKERRWEGFNDGRE